MAKKRKPTKFIALYNYTDEVEADDGDDSIVTPAVSAHLEFQRGDVMSTTANNSRISTWIFCQSIHSGKSGYVKSSMLAPLLAGESESTKDNVALLPARVKTKHMKFFTNSPVQNPKRTCPVEGANIFSLITFGWMTSLIYKGYKKTLTDSDMWNLPKSETVAHNEELFQKHWQAEMDKWKKHRAKEELKGIEGVKDSETTKLAEEGEAPESTPSKSKDKYKPSLTKALFHTHYPTIVLAAFFKLANDSLQFVSPWLLGKIIDTVEDHSSDIRWGYFYAGMLLPVGAGTSIALHQYFQRAYVVANRVRSTLISCVYKKTLRLNNKSRGQFTAGEMVNLMSVDVQKANNVFTMGHLMWSAPFQIVVSLFFLYRLLGWPTFAGFFILVLIIPVNSIFSNIQKKVHTEQMKHKDMRSKLMNEIIAAINIVKLYSWEDSFILRIIKIRSKELDKLRKEQLIQSSYSFTLNCAPFLVAAATFATYVLDGNTLTAKKAFVALSLFNIIRFPLFMLPTIITNLMNYIVSSKRLTNFLKGDELEPLTFIEDSANSVEIKNASFTWDDTQTDILRDINLVAPKGSLTAIVGQVGVGKSSLMSAVLGEIKKSRGDVRVCGSTAYVAQQAWIQNRTLRDNVLLSHKYDSVRYENVLAACALTSDIRLLADGDLTQIGEKGVNLSGGQKQRVSLARAVYSDADVYLMDDPLSAVDAHVGKHIFDQVLGKDGILSDKSRILITHNLSFLPEMDQIIVIKDNTISEYGTYTELKEKGGPFSEFLETYQNKEIRSNNSSMEECEITKSLTDVPEVAFSDVSLKVFTGGRAVSENVFEGNYAHQMMESKVFGGTLEDLSDTQKTRVQEILELHRQQEEEKRHKNIVADETSETGTVKRAVFLTYSKYIGVVTTILFLLTGLMTESLTLVSRLWLAQWTSAVNITESERDMYLAVYSGIGFGESISVLVQALIMVLGTICASRLLHSRLLQNVLRCPMSFFEATPMGRIIHRFAKDINLIDEDIPKSLKSFVRCFFTFLGTAFIITYTTPIFLAAFIPIAIGYAVVQRFYVASSRQLKRMESVRRAPIFNHFFESINGASTIRAYRLSEASTQECQRNIDYSVEAYFPSVTANRWLAMRLEFCGHLITVAAAFFCVISRQDITPGLAGLSVSYALQVTQTLTWLVRMSSEIETNIIGVERVLQYINISSEGQPDKEKTALDAAWPEKGAISFKGFSMRYRDGLDLVLKDLSFDIAPSEKVGVVGRTGAGKSSMAIVLFRILESSAGAIKIDGVDISTISLKELRSRITIIPQEPVLFSGSIRFNLDPFDQHTDEQVWRVLEVCNIKEYVSNAEGALSHEVMEGGQNLSVGQRQLICLARALLRRSKILIMDEATSSVDMGTDSFIQQVIREELKACTVICIAHRLNTVMDYDTIIVLSEGKIVEQGSPADLINKKGEFYKLVKESNVKQHN